MGDIPLISQYFQFKPGNNEVDKKQHHFAQSVLIGANGQNLQQQKQYSKSIIQGTGSYGKQIRRESAKPSGKSSSMSKGGKTSNEAAVSQ